MTELIWDGKYKDGKKAAPVRIALPFQTIETVNESAADRQKRYSSIFSQKHENTAWRNRLIWGDKKYVLPSLLPELAGKVNLIYIDPPFNVGSDFSFTATIGSAPTKTVSEPAQDTAQDTASFVKQPSIIEQKAYRDTWGKGLDSYLQWFYETVILLRELLADNGSIYVHLDYRMGHYAKVILDEVFGYDNFLNEIVWCYTGGTDTKNYWQRKHDNIYFYSKSNKWIFNEDFVPFSENTIKRFNKEDEKGRYKINTLADGRVTKTYMKEEGKRSPDYWDIPIVNRTYIEGIGYDTQKPEALLERIIKASSNEGDLVLDCFCGSGTTAAVAEKLGRRWLTCDLGRFAIHTARKRFLGIPDVKPFVVQNLGKYERQQWQLSELGIHNSTDLENQTTQKVEAEKAYRNFICDLYHAQTLSGYVWLHGAKAGRLLHVGSVDAPVTVEDIKQTIVEFWKLAGKEQAAATNGIDFLGWDFAFDVNETAAQFAATNRVDVKFKKIPREVLEKKAVEQGDIKFYELASLDVKTKISPTHRGGAGGGVLTVSLNNFIIPPDDIPEEVRKSITHWSQWIDYWAVDWNYRDDTFHNQWQSYRTKQNPKIELAAANTYHDNGTFTVLVKVIDILGNDTTKAITIEI